MRGFSDCCHYDEGYDDGYDDGKDARGDALPAVSFADMLCEWAHRQRDPALAEAALVVADAAGQVDMEVLAEDVEERREKLLAAYAASISARATLEPTQILSPRASKETTT